MKVKKSPLKLDEFVLLNLDYQFIEPKDKIKIDVKNIIYKYDIDIDVAEYAVTGGFFNFLFGFGFVYVKFVKGGGYHLVNV